MLDRDSVYFTLSIGLAYAQKEGVMRTVSIFKNGKNQAVRLPKDFEFDGVNELEIHKEGDVITLRPVRPDWLSFGEQEKADSDFMVNREDVMKDEGRFNFE